MIWFWLWMLALCDSDRQPREPSDWITPVGWTGNPWGPEATRARLVGQLPPLPDKPELRHWGSWGRRILQDGDIVFRLGDSRMARGIFPLSWFIAKATRSPFSHTGVVAVEDGLPMVYDCSSVGVRRQPFEVWILDCVGSWGVKRLKPEQRGRIPGVLSYCREKFEQQVPFDFAFRLDDSALYCLEMTEKAFRSQGLVLSEPVRIGDWRDLRRYPLTSLAILYCTRLVLDQPITLDQPVYLPGSESEGIWASPALETVVGPAVQGAGSAAQGNSDGFGLSGDTELIAFVAVEMRRSYASLPLRWLSARTLRLLRRCHLIARAATRFPCLDWPASGIKDEIALLHLSALRHCGVGWRPSNLGGRLRIPVGLRPRAGSKSARANGRQTRRRTAAPDAHLVRNTTRNPGASMLRSASPLSYRPTARGFAT
jgi:hypothetical protein